MVVVLKEVSMKSFLKVFSLLIFLQSAPLLAETVQIELAFDELKVIAEEGAELTSYTCDDGQTISGIQAPAYQIKLKSGQTCTASIAFATQAD
jgi:hypothetical protein